MTVTAIHLHPVKGCRRVEVDRAVVGPFGLVGDREWQVAPEGGEGFLTQRTHPALTQIRPALTEGELVLRAEGRPDLPVTRPTAVDGTTGTFTGEVPAADAGDDAAEWLAGVLGEPVRLVGIAAGYERTFPPAFGDHQLGFGDAAPLLVVNEASHRFLVERATEPFGVDRWRPNLVVDAGEPWVEDRWRVVRIGDAVVDCRLPWPRCAVPQVDQETGERRREPAVVLKQHRWCDALPHASALEQHFLCGNALFGVAAAVVPDGAEIEVGDPVEVLTTTVPLVRA